MLFIMKINLFFLFAIFMIFWFVSGVMAMDYTEYFDRKEFEKVPEVYASEVPVMGTESWHYSGILTKESEREADKNNNYIKPIMYEGPDCKGKKTRVFAWIGVPPCKKGEKVPAMVLVHGGGGTAFEAWVRLWNARGYAAIAMDTCGCVPVGEYSHWQEHEWSGHNCWGDVINVDLPYKDQWPYQAVMEVLLGTSLLASYPEVDENKIGITGISWGGWLTCICAAADKRFAFANPIYGCGHFEYALYWEIADYIAISTEKYKKWLNLWDPCHFLPNVNIPIHWIVGCNDHAFWPRAQRASMADCPEYSHLHLKKELVHDHGEHGESQEESLALADYYLKGGAKVTEVKTKEKDGFISFETDNAVKSAVLLWTEEANPCPETQWQEIPVDLNTKSVKVPENAETYFINVTDTRGLLISSPISVKRENIDDVLAEMRKTMAKETAK